jgi:hypothetical protein
MMVREGATNKAWLGIQFCQNLNSDEQDIICFARQKELQLCYYFIMKCPNEISYADLSFNKFVINHSGATRQLTSDIRITSLLLY